MEACVHFVKRSFVTNRPFLYSCMLKVACFHWGEGNDISQPSLLCFPCEFTLTSYLSTLDQSSEEAGTFKTFIAQNTGLKTAVVANPTLLFDLFVKDQFFFICFNMSAPLF